MPVGLDWPDESALRLVVPAVGLTWTSQVRATAVTRAFSTLGEVLPARAWRSGAVLAVMSSVAEVAAENPALLQTDLLRLQTDLLRQSLRQACPDLRKRIVAPAHGRSEKFS